MKAKAKQYLKDERQHRHVCSDVLERCPGRDNCCSCWRRGGDGDALEALGLPGGFESMTQEDAEFMIDLMDTLLD